MKLLETYVEISAKDTALKTGMKNARRYVRGEVTEMQRLLNSLSFKSFSLRNMFIGGAAATGAIYGIKASVESLIGSTATLGETFDKMSLRTGISVETLSELKHAADLSGASIEEVEKSTKLLSKNMLDASRGIGTAKDTMDEMGISATDASGNLRPVMDVLMQTADLFSKMTDETKASAYASQLFGRSGTMLLPMLKEGSAGMREMMEEARRLGITMSTQTSKDAAKFDDTITRLKGALEGVKRSIASGIIPVFTEYARVATEWVVLHREMIGIKVKEWLDKIGAGLTFLYNHRETIKNVFEIAFISMAIGKLLTLTAVITKLAQALIALGTAGTASAALKIISSGALGSALAALANPVGAAVLTTFAAIGAATYLIHNNLKKVSELNFANTHELARDFGKIDINNLQNAKPMELPGLVHDPNESVLTLGGYRTYSQVQESPVTGPGTGGGGGKPDPTLGFNIKDRIAQLDTLSWKYEVIAGKNYKFQNPSIDAFSADRQALQAQNIEAFNQAAMDSWGELDDIADEVWRANLDRIESQKDAWLNFGDTIGQTMMYAMETSGNTFQNIANGFKNMLESMAAQWLAKAAVFELISFFNPMGAASKLPSFLSFVSGGLLKASGGPVEANTPYIVGEKRPELFVPKTAGTILPYVPKAAATGTTINDNSSWSININQADARNMTGLPDEEFARQFKRCERDGRIKVRKTA